MDSFLDPRTAGLLGALGGLLSTSGPSRLPMGAGQAVGQGLLNGMGAYTMAQQQQKNDVLLGLQAQALKKQMAIDEERQRLLAGGQPPSAAGGATAPNAPGMSPNTSNLLFGSPDFATLPQQTPKPQTGFSLDQLQRLAAIGDPQVGNMLKLWELQNPEMGVSNGYAYNKRGIQPGFLPQVNISQNGQAVGVLPSANGGLPSVSALPGSIPTFGAFQDAAEAAKARRDPFLGQVDPQGRPIPQTREQFAERVGGISAPSASGAPSGGPMGMGPTPAVRAGAEAIGKSDAERVSALEQKIPSMLSVSRRLDRMAALTADDKTYAAAGSELKTTLGSIAQAFGLKVNPAKTANSEEYLAHVAELLKDRLASKDYGSGTGISNLDLIAARGPLPELAKTAQGRMQLIGALKADTERNLKDAQAARDYFDSRGGLRGFRFPSEIAADAQKKTDELKNITGSTGEGLPSGVRVTRINR